MSVYLKIIEYVALAIRFILIVISLPIVGFGALSAFVYKRFMDGVEIYNIYIKDK